MAAADAPAVPAPHASNLSTRASVAGDGGVLIPGFVVAGGGSKTLLIRGVGPALTAFGVDDALPAPRLTLYRDDEVITSNRGWSTSADAAEIAATAATVGAFSFAEDSADSALLASVTAGIYTAHLASADRSSGSGLVEVYDAGGDTSARLINLSARAELAPGGEALIPGFVVAGDGARTYLIRAVGPGLRNFGVVDALENPQLALYRDGVFIAGNDDWFAAGNAAQTATMSEQLGAFALADDGADAALAIALAPGAYSVHVTAADAAGGTVLVEIYAAP